MPELAVEQVYSLCHRYANAIALRFGIDADDLASDTFVSLLGTLENLRDSGSLPVFVHRALWFRANHARIKRTRCGNLNHLIHHHRVETPEEICQGRDTLRVALEALKKLSPRQREIIRQFYLDGEDAATIQARLQLTDTQFRLHKSRGLSKLRQMSVSK